MLFQEQFGVGIVDALDLWRPWSRAHPWRADLDALFRQILRDTPLSRDESEPHHCKYTRLVAKLDAWVKVATHKLAQVKGQVEQRRGDQVKAETAVVTSDREGTQDKGVMAGGGGDADTLTDMSPVKTENQSTELNEYGSLMSASPPDSVKVKVEPDSAMTAIKPKVEYKVGRRPSASTAVEASGSTRPSRCRAWRGG